jgi:hypothetical protein
MLARPRACSRTPAAARAPRPATAPGCQSSHSGSGQVWSPPDNFDWEEGREVSEKQLDEFQRQLDLIG